MSVIAGPGGPGNCASWIVRGRDLNAIPNGSYAVWSVENWPAIRWSQRRPDGPVRDRWSLARIAIVRLLASRLGSGTRVVPPTQWTVQTLGSSGQIHRKPCPDLPAYPD